MGRGSCAYYRLVLEYEQGILLVAEHDAGIVAFVAGFIAPARFYQAMVQRKCRFAFHVLMRVALRPLLLPRVLWNYRRTANAGQNREARSDTTCELSSVGVLPSHEGNQLGSQLVLRFIERARGLGATSVYLTTDAKGNERVQRFYQRLGFHADRNNETAGHRVMTEYVLPLDVEAKG